MKFKVYFMISWLLLMAFPLSAIELNLDQEEFKETEIFSEDYLFAGKSLQFEGEANDLFAVAEDKVDFSGTTQLALFSAAGEIVVSGIVGNGVKAISPSITLEGKITGTSFLVAENLTLTPESSTEGATFFAGRKIEVKGPVTGDFYAGAGEVVIENEIRGNVKIHAGQLKITEQGKIVGDLVYESDQKLSEAEAARVMGEITFKKNEDSDFQDSFSKEDSPGWLLLSLFFKGAFAVLGFLLLLFPVSRRLEKRLTPKEILTHSLWGLLPIFVYPSALVVSILLVITIPLAIALFLGFIPLLFTTKVIGITLIGGLIATALKVTSNSRFLFFLIGVLLYSLLSFIPFVGYLLMVFISAIGCGVLLSSLFQMELLQKMGRD